MGPFAPISDGKYWRMDAARLAIALGAPPKGRLGAPRVESRTLVVGVKLHLAPEAPRRPARRVALCIRC